MKKNNSGRPQSVTTKDCTNFNDKVLQKLEDCFNKGMNNSEACLRANISERIFYDVLKTNEGLKNRFILLRNNLKARTKEILAKDIESGNIDTAKWYAERKMKDEFSTRQENINENNGELTVKVMNYGDNSTK